MKLYIGLICLALSAQVFSQEIIDPPKVSMGIEIPDKISASAKRNRELKILRANYYLKQNYRESIKILSNAIASWQGNKFAKDEYIMACEKLFAFLHFKNKYKKYRENLDKCPQDIVNASHEDYSRPYMPITKVAPLMPGEAIDNNIQGYVILRYDVNKRGRPKNIEVIEASNEIFIKPSIKSVKQYFYLPTIQGGIAVIETGVMSKITFKLSG